MTIQTIRQAVLSVFDKRGIVELGKFLETIGCQILSTGGTGRALKEAGINYQEVSDYTGTPEMLRGRVKTLHPKIHGGILFRRVDPAQVEEVEKYGIKPIELVAVNLYPFEKTVSNPDVTTVEATENIDIGGPALIRAAAKNFFSVVVLTDPKDYPTIIKEMENSGGVSLETRRRLATKAFEHTSQYDKAIHEYFSTLSSQGLKA